MCVAVPLKIKSIQGSEATGEALGASRTIRIDLLPGIRTGDYVIVHAGIAIAKIQEKEAEEDLKAIRDVIDAERACVPFSCTENEKTKEASHAAGV